jgi:hypothetical protein
MAGLVIRGPAGGACPALSLGVDLGLGQPMEHGLRQCLIAPRLLVNVRCHADAHEQAK